jgi:molecular chaperone IbpA
MKGEKMTKFTSMDLSPFYRNSIGVDRLFDRLINQMDTGSANNYPPYNIIKKDENNFEVEVAVAGFSQGEISVDVRDSNLIISGEKKEFEVEPEYLYHGISARRFVRSFSLSEYVEVVTALVKDGILTIKLERRLPEAMKPKTIAITYAN